MENTKHPEKLNWTPSGLIQRLFLAIMLDIDHTFARFGLTYLPGQREAIQQIVTAILKATPRNRPPKIVSVARNAESWIKCMEYSRSSIRGATRLDRQAGPVSQNEVCQSKQHILFCRLFSQTSVSGLSIFESPFYYRKDMFDFCPDG